MLKLEEFLEQAKNIAVAEDENVEQFLRYCSNRLSTILHAGDFGQIENRNEFFLALIDGFREYKKLGSKLLR